MPRTEWVGVVDFHDHAADDAEQRFADVRARVDAQAEVEVVASEPGNITLRWAADDRDAAVARLHELVGVRPEELAPGHPQPA